MRAVEHPGPITQRGRIGQLLLGGLFHDATELFQSADGLLEAHGIADLNGARQRFLRLHRFEGLEVSKKGAIERVGAFRLGDHDARQLGD